MQAVGSTLILSGVRLLRSNRRGKTQQSWSGKLQRASQSNLCTRVLIYLMERIPCMIFIQKEERRCQASTHTPGGPTQPCMPTSHGPSGNTLASAQWKKATSSTKLILQLDSRVLVLLLTWPRTGVTTVMMSE